MSSAATWIALVATALVVVVVRHVVRQSTFRRGATCLSDLRSVAVDVPEVDVDALRSAVAKQSGLAVSGTRFTESDLDRLVPDVMAFVRSDAFRSSARALIGFEPASTLVFGRLYERGDYIDWHYDQNLTSGRKYTAILNVHIPQCNTSHFEFRDPCTSDVRRPSQAQGTLFVYPGDEVFHHVTEQLSEDCDRFVLIFGFSETRERTLLQRLLHVVHRLASPFVSY